jgi:cell division transport system ATP-binding protein
MMIIFDQVTKRYGNGTVALDHVDLNVEPGEFVVIVGHSGAGKTTLQKLLIKETLPDSGIIKVDGDEISKISGKNTPLLRRKIGVVFQDFKILFEKTVGENILLVLDILGVEHELAEKRLQELLELTGLIDKKDHFPVQLSGGELQRVAIARALAGEPKVLFADEPTGNLDDQTGLQIIELLQDINQHGTTVLMATHDKHLVKDKKLRVIEFEHGKLIKDSKEKKHEQT